MGPRSLRFEPTAPGQAAPESRGWGRERTKGCGQWACVGGRPRAFSASLERSAWTGRSRTGTFQNLLT